MKVDSRGGEDGLPLWEIAKEGGTTHDEKGTFAQTAVTEKSPTTGWLQPQTGGRENAVKDVKAVWFGSESPSVVQ